MSSCRRDITAEARRGLRGEAVVADDSVAGQFDAVLSFDFEPSDLSVTGLLIPITIDLLSLSVETAHRFDSSAGFYPYELDV